MKSVNSLNSGVYDKALRPLDKNYLNQRDLMTNLNQRLLKVSNNSISKENFPICQRDKKLQEIIIEKIIDSSSEDIQFGRRNSWLSQLSWKLTSVASTKSVSQHQSPLSNQMTQKLTRNNWMSYWLSDPLQHQQEFSSPCIGNQSHNRCKSCGKKKKMQTQRDKTPSAITFTDQSQFSPSPSPLKIQNTIRNTQAQLWEKFDLKSAIE